MQASLYTEKSLSECVSALKERFDHKSGGRAPISGWVERDGKFSMSVTTEVIAGFKRSTTLEGKLVKGDGVTTVRADVPDGATAREIAGIYALVGVIAVGLFASGNALIVVAALPLMIYAYVPMRGDHHNSALLLSDLQRVLKAKAKPPKKPPTDASRRPKK